VFLKPVFGWRTVDPFSAQAAERELPATPATLAR
jgi:hypothetical protein